MPFHNPFIRTDGSSSRRAPAWSSTSRRWAKVRGDKPAYRFLDFSTERDGVAGADLGRFPAPQPMPSAPGCSRSPSPATGWRSCARSEPRLHLVAFFGTLYSGRIAVPLFDPSEPSRGSSAPVLDDCQPSAILTTTGPPRACEVLPAAVRQRSVPVSSPSTRFPTRSAQPGRCPTAVRRRSQQYTSGSTRVPSGVQITHLEPGHQRGAGDPRRWRVGSRPGGCGCAVLPRHGPGHRAPAIADRPLLHLS